MLVAITTPKEIRSAAEAESGRANIPESRERERSRSWLTFNLVQVFGVGCVSTATPPGPVLLTQAAGLGCGFISSLVYGALTLNWRGSAAPVLMDSVVVVVWK